MKLAELLANPKYGKVIMRKILLIITFTILLIFGLFNTQTLLNVFFTILNAATPFLSGIFVAYILNVIVKAFEEHVFNFLNRKNTSGGCVYAGRSAFSFRFWCWRACLPCFCGSLYPN